MKYLKEFSTENDYLAYRDSKDYLKPNVSLSDDKGSVYYNFTPPPPDFNGHDYVDLGLPSGTLWASCNVGASKPTDYGQYFQWGDTIGYTKDQVGKDKQFKWSDYKWNPSGDGETFTKYANFGDTLDLEDDAAHVHMGGDWHMPSKAQCEELINNTTISWTTLDGIEGMTFTSKNDLGKLIFIPLAGAAYDGSVLYSGDAGGVWCSMSSTDRAYGLGAYSDSPTPIVDTITRDNGVPIRGVIG